MDGLKSFYEIEDGLEHISKHDFVAMIYDEPFHSFKEYNCKVKRQANCFLIKSFLGRQYKDILLSIFSFFISLSFQYDPD